jgi:phenylacetate-CoA ligase
MLPHELRHLRRLIKDQWLPPERLREVQERKLRRLVAHAYERVPYYRRLFDSVGLKPADIRGLSDLEKVPMTTRNGLLEHPLTDITARGIDLKRCRVQMTSGTTGVPFRHYHRRSDLTRVNFGWARAYLAHGMKLRDRIASFQGRRDAGRTRSWYEALGVWRRRMLSASDLPETWISDLTAWKPQVLLGYSMTLALLASALRARPALRYRPRLIFHTSGLLLERDREDIARALASRVIDLYGSEEGGCIAWECPRCRGYHVNADMVALEIVEAGRIAPVGTPGEVVITNLHSFAQPLIRYRQGDIAAWSLEAPACGRGLPLIENIQGRIDDFVILPSGRRVSPHPLHWAVLAVPGIKRWRIVQEARDRIRVEVVAGPEFPADGPAVIEANVRRILAENAAVAVAVVDAIAQDPRKKFRLVVSNVSTDP